MTTAEILLDLRKRNNLSQEEMADKLLVTRQAVSRWENDETVPSTDTLKIISKAFGISINTLLGQPQKLFCQACGMPLSDDDIAREADGGFDEDYCKWCLVDGEYVGPSTVEGMIDVCVPHMGMPEADAREFLRHQLPSLKHWQNNPAAPTN